MRLTALASTITAEILSNNFPCISTFPCVRLKTMAYLRVIPNFSSILLFSIRIIRFSQVFSAFLLGVCVALCLIHLTFDVIYKSGKIIEPFCPRRLETNSSTIQFKGPYSSVYWNGFVVRTVVGSYNFSQKYLPSQNLKYVK